MNGLMMIPFLLAGDGKAIGDAIVGESSYVGSTMDKAGGHITTILGGCLMIYAIYCTASHFIKKGSGKVHWLKIIAMTCIGGAMMVTGGFWSGRGGSGDIDAQGVTQAVYNTGSEFAEGAAPGAIAPPGTPGSW